MSTRTTSAGIRQALHTSSHWKVGASDLEVELRQQVNLTDWNAEVRLSGEFTPGTLFYVQFSAENLAVTKGLEVGTKLRLIDGYVNRQINDEAILLPVVSMGRTSEVFVITTA